MPFWDTDYKKEMIKSKAAKEAAEERAAEAKQKAAEAKQRAVMLGGDAVVSMRQDIDLDTSGFQYFYLQMYGTVVKRING